MPVVSTFTREVFPAFCKPIRLSSISLWKNRLQVTDNRSFQKSTDALFYFKSCRHMPNLPSQPVEETVEPAEHTVLPWTEQIKPGCASTTCSSVVPLSNVQNAGNSMCLPQFQRGNSNALQGDDQGSNLCNSWVLLWNAGQFLAGIRHPFPGIPRFLPQRDKARYSNVLGALDNSTLGCARFRTSHTGRFTEDCWD